MDKEIDIFEHMTNMNSYLAILEKKIIEYELDNRWEYYDFIKSLINEVKVPGKLVISKHFNFNEKGFQQQYKFINKRLINFMDHILNM